MHFATNKLLKIWTLYTVPRVCQRIISHITLLRILDVAKQTQLQGLLTTRLKNPPSNKILLVIHTSVVGLALADLIISHQVAISVASQRNGPHIHLKMNLGITN